jgi:hypothetical protein
VTTPAPRPEALALPSAASWSEKFPSASSPAAVKLGQTNFSRIREVPLPKPLWLGDAGKEATREPAFTFDYSKLRLGEFVNRIRDMNKNLPELGKTAKQPSEEYSVQIVNLEKSTVSCVAAGTCPQTLESETIQNKSDRAESKQDWLSMQGSRPYQQLGLADLSDTSDEGQKLKLPATKSEQLPVVQQPTPESGPLFPLPECEGERCVVNNPQAFVPCAHRATAGDPQAKPPVPSMLPVDAPTEMFMEPKDVAICTAAYDNFRQNMQSNIRLLRGQEVRQWSDAFLLSAHQQIVQFKRTSSQQSSVRCSRTNLVITTYMNALRFCSSL